MHVLCVGPDSLCSGADKPVKKREVQNKKAGKIYPRCQRALRHIFKYRILLSCRA